MESGANSSLLSSVTAPTASWEIDFSGPRLWGWNQRQHLFCLCYVVTVIYFLFLVLPAVVFSFRPWGCVPMFPPQHREVILNSHSVSLQIRLPPSRWKPFPTMFIMRGPISARGRSFSLWWARSDAVSLKNETMTAKQARRVEQSTEQRLQSNGYRATFFIRNRLNKDVERTDICMEIFRLD